MRQQKETCSLCCYYKTDYSSDGMCNWKEYRVLGRQLGCEVWIHLDRKWSSKQSPPRFKKEVGKAA